MPPEPFAIEEAAFWTLASITVFSALFVVAARNPVRSVMWLILTFFSSAGLFVLIGAEFLAMLLVVVYVGAVSVLFLFVVMMLDVNFVELKQGFLQYAPVGAIIAIALALELVLVGASWHAGQDDQAIAPMASPNAPSNAEALGRVLYGEYAFMFQISGLVLLVAMVGAIVLTLRHREGVKRQDIGAQVARRAKDGVRLVDPKPGEGV